MRVYSPEISAQYRKKKKKKAACFISGQITYIQQYWELGLQYMGDKEISPHPSMTDIEISCAGVFKLLRELDVHKAAGLDGLSPKLLKELAEELAPIDPNSMLFQAT